VIGNAFAILCLSTIIIVDLEVRKKNEINKRKKERIKPMVKCD